MSRLALATVATGAAFGADAAALDAAGILALAAGVLLGTAALTRLGEVSGRTAGLDAADDGAAHLLESEALGEIRRHRLHGQAHG